MGLLISIPLIIFGSTLVLKLMDRFAILITAGGALLGYVAGEMVMQRAALRPWLPPEEGPWSVALPAAGALLVIGIGKWLAGAARRRQKSRKVIELADGKRK